MAREPLFAGLVIDEFDRPVEVAHVGSESMYVVDDDGFRRHIPSEQVDRQVLALITEGIEGNEDLISEEASKMLGQDDIFSRASIANQLKNIEGQFDLILENGIPEAQRAYMGMLGFKIRINLHGEVIEVDQPRMIDPDSEN